MVGHSTPEIITLLSTVSGLLRMESERAKPPQVSSKPQEDFQFMSHARSVITALAVVVIASPLCVSADIRAVEAFTAASTGTSLEQVLYDQEHRLPDAISFGAQHQTTASEPGTPSLMLGGFLLLAAGMFRRKRTR
jgi:hypothetical protein